MSQTSEPLTVAPNRETWNSAGVYDDLLDSLERIGFEMRVQEPRDGNYSLGGIVTDPAIAVSVYVGVRLGQAALARPAEPAIAVP